MPETRCFLIILTFVSNSSRTKILCILTSKSPRLNVHSFFESVTDSNYATSYLELGLLDVFLSVRRKSRSIEGCPLTIATYYELFSPTFLTPCVVRWIKAILTLAFNMQGCMISTILAVKTSIKYISRTLLFHISPMAFDSVIFVLAQIEILANH